MSSKLIVYDGIDEVIVCTPEDELEMLREFFPNSGYGRDPEEYDRVEVEGSVQIAARMRVEFANLNLNKT